MTETSCTAGDHRRFAFDAYKHLISKLQENRKVVGYERVSSHDQRNDLDTQTKRLQDYGCDEVVADLGSGLNCNKVGLRKLMKQL